MSVNLKKCRFLPFKGYNNRKFCPDSHVLEKKSIEKDLGIEVSDNFAWDVHINTMC